MKGLRYMNYIDGILEKYGLNLDELLILIVSFTVFSFMFSPYKTL